MSSIAGGHNLSVPHPLRAIPELSAECRERYQIRIGCFGPTAAGKASPNPHLTLLLGGPFASIRSNLRDILTHRSAPTCFGASPISRRSSSRRFVIPEHIDELVSARWVCALCSSSAQMRHIGAQHDRGSSQRAELSAGAVRSPLSWGSRSAARHGPLRHDFATGAFAIASDRVQSRGGDPACSAEEESVHDPSRSRPRPHRLRER